MRRGLVRVSQLLTSSLSYGGQAVVVPARTSGRLRVYGPDGLLGVGQGLGDRVKPERLLHADPERSSVLPA